MNRSSANAGAAAQEALRELQANAIAYRRQLADGRLVVVERLSFGSARIYLAPARAGEEADFWDYGSVNEAIAEAVLWNAEKEPEPARWLRHEPSGRKRPGGCAELEYVAPNPLQ